MEKAEYPEDEEIRNILRDAYGYSDEQLLHKLKSAGQSLESTDFLEAKERMAQKLRRLIDKEK